MPTNHASELRDALQLVANLLTSGVAEVESGSVTNGQPSQIAIVDLHYIQKRVEQVCSARRGRPGAQAWWHYLALHLAAIKLMH